MLSLELELEASYAVSRNSLRLKNKGYKILLEYELLCIIGDLVAVVVVVVFYCVGST